MKFHEDLFIDSRVVRGKTQSGHADMTSYAYITSGMSKVRTGFSQNLKVKMISTYRVESKINLRSYKGKKCISPNNYKGNFMYLNMIIESGEPKVFLLNLNTE
jgi:hypothetical protein